MPTLLSACLRCTSSLSRFANVAVAKKSLFNKLWYQTKTGIKLLLGLHETKRSSLSGPVAKLPQELVEEIISYFFDDKRTLLACSLTCRPWYIATLPYLHHSLTTDDDSIIQKDKKQWWPEPLKRVHELNLHPFVKRLRIRMRRRNPSFTPERLGGYNMGYFYSLKNLRELGVDDLQVDKFMPYPQRFFGHLSPTLQLLALRRPRGSSRQIVYFIGLFPHLQDLKLHYTVLENEEENLADTTLVPLCSPPLRGRLTLTMFTREQIVKDMITVFGGLQFHQMDLFGVKCLPLLMEECAGTLETLRLYPNDPYGKVCF